MSGKDERKVNIYPPDCPYCHRCAEWYIGGGTWIMTKKSMKRRGLEYPVIVISQNEAPQNDRNFVMCVEMVGTPRCRTKFDPNTDIYKAVIKAFKANCGKPYHEDGLRGNVSNVW